MIRLGPWFPVSAEPQSWPIPLPTQPLSPEPRGSTCPCPVMPMLYLVLRSPSQHSPTLATSRSFTRRTPMRTSSPRPPSQARSQTRTFQASISPWSRCSLPTQDPHSYRLPLFAGRPAPARVGLQMGPQVCRTSWSVAFRLPCVVMESGSL